MNRFQLLDGPLDDLLEAQPINREFSHCSSVGGGSGHASFVPLHYEPNYAYPLLVWLHGMGQSEQQVRTVVPGISVRNYVAVAPRCRWAGPRGEGTPRPRTELANPSPEEVTELEHEVLACIQGTRERFHISPQRIFVLGSDYGGTMALRIAMMHPERFAGAVSIGGGFPRGNTPLARIRQARRVQVLIEHRRRDSSYREAAVCDDLRLLHSAGMSVTLRQYPCGDTISSQMLADVDPWIMQQVTGAWAGTDRSNDYRPHQHN